MLGGLGTTTKDIPPFVLQQGYNCVTGLNLIGLRRAGISAEAINAPAIGLSNGLQGKVDRWERPSTRSRPTWARLPRWPNSSGSSASRIWGSTGSGKLSAKPDLLIERDFGRGDRRRRPDLLRFRGNASQGFPEFAGIRPCRFRPGAEPRDRRRKDRLPNRHRGPDMAWRILEITSTPMPTTVANANTIRPNWRSFSGSSGGVRTVRRGMRAASSRDDFGCRFL